MGGLAQRWLGDPGAREGVSMEELGGKKSSGAVKTKKQERLHPSTATAKEVGGLTFKEKD